MTNKAAETWVLVGLRTKLAAYMYTDLNLENLQPLRDEVQQRIDDNIEQDKRSKVQV